MGWVQKESKLSPPLKSSKEIPVSEDSVECIYWETAGWMAIFNTGVRNLVQVKGKVEDQGFLPCLVPCWKQVIFVKEILAQEMGKKAEKREKERSPIELGLKSADEWYSLQSH